MARPKGSRTGRCQGCNHLERVRIERLLAAGASIKGTARKFTIDHHALRRHWINHVSGPMVGMISGWLPPGRHLLLYGPPTSPRVGSWEPELRLDFKQDCGGPVVV